MKVLALETAFQAGSQLWFVPDLNVSSWTREIDWYLGFQIFNARLFTPKSLPDEVRKILDDNKWQSLEVPQQPDGTLGLVTAGRLPTDNLLVISKTEAKDWISTSVAIWKKAKKPSARLFLPAAVTLKQLQTLWPEAEDLTVVLNR